MSTIVVVQKGHTACIAADSLTSFGDQTLGAQYDCHSDKIQKIHNSYFGIVGSAAHSLVVESALKSAGTTARLKLGDRRRCRLRPRRDARALRPTRFGRGHCPRGN